MAELDGYLKLSRGETDAAFAEFAKAPTTCVPNASPACTWRPELRTWPNPRPRKAVNSHPNQFPPLACLRRDPARRRQDRRRPRTPIAALGPLWPMPTRLAGRQPARGDRRRVENRRRLVARPRLPRRPTPLTADRIDLTTLGPLTWAPYPAESIAGVDTDGQDLEPRRPQGPERPRPVLPRRQVRPLHAATHRVRQGGRGTARRLNTDVVAIGTDDLEATTAIKQNADGVEFPMPLLADPTLALFKSLPLSRRLRGRAAARHVPDRRPRRRPVPADRRRAVPGRRVHQE